MFQLIADTTIGITILLAVLLLKEGIKNLSTFILVSWLSVTVIELYVTNQIYEGSSNSYFYIKSILPLLHVGLLYIYLKTLINKHSSLKLLLYLLPFGLFLTLGFLYDERKLIIDYQFNLIILVLVGLYLFFSIRLFKENSSRKIYFLRNVLLLYVLVWISLVICNSYLTEYRLELLWAGMLSFTALIWVFVLNSLRIKILQEMKVKMKYLKSGMTLNKARALKNQLENILENEKSYLNPNLKLSDISKLMNVPDNYVSQVINTEFEMSFNDLINQYRVEDFKDLVAKGNKNHLTLYAIAQECGFQSKSTFNSAFKKATGVTPSKFKINLTSNPTNSVA